MPALYPHSGSYLWVQQLTRSTRECIEGSRRLLAQTEVLVRPALPVDGGSVCSALGSAGAEAGPG